MEESAKTVTLWPDIDHGPLELTLDWQVIGGRWECVALRIAPAPGVDPRPLTTGDLRGVALRTIVAKGANELGLAALDDWLQTLRGGSREEARAAQERMSLGPPRSAGDPQAPTLEEVAQVYTTAVQQHKPPTKAVQEYFGITYSAAAHKITRCREPNVRLLGSTERGLAGGILPTDTDRKEQP